MTTGAGARTSELMDACRQLSGRVVERTFELALVPAPPLDEADRARVVRAWWEADGLAVRRQDAGNLWARLRPGTDPAAAAIVVAAHLDTVFGREVEHGLRRTPDGRVVGPGCGDDTVAVAALSLLDRLLPARTAVPVWIVATVGEEGLGDLAGARAALADPPAPVGAFVALEGNYLGRVNTVGVGSERRRVRVSGPGGHAWEDADAASAVHAAAAFVCGIDRVRITGDAKTSRNVGLVRGGESINSRAAGATFDLDLRSADPAALRDLLAGVEAVLAGGPEGIEVTTEVLGSRPAGHVPIDDPLVRAAARALRETGIEPAFTAASTDANAAYAAGVPAVTLGITYGDGTHTLAEWIDPDSVHLGLFALTRTVLNRSELP